LTNAEPGRARRVFFFNSVGRSPPPLRFLGRQQAADTVQTVGPMSKDATMQTLPAIHQDEQDEIEPEIPTIGQMDRLVRQYGPRMLRTARGILRDRDEAEDAVQDAWLAALRAKDQFEGRALPSTWLHRIVVNACLMRLRHQRSLPYSPSIDAAPLGAGGIPAPQAVDGDAAHRAARSETARIVTAAIAKLPGRHRDVLALRDLQQLDTLTTAKRLGISVNAAKIRLHRARHALRLVLADGAGIAA
jgi:RNA polymerase sigma-70 factor (ECF subfamily)